MAAVAQDKESTSAMNKPSTVAKKPSSEVMALSTEVLAKYNVQKMSASDVESLNADFALFDNDGIALHT